MIWIQHDFYSNFINSVGSVDTELTISIFVSEITDLVVHDTKNLLSIFEKTGIKIRKKASDEEIVDAILDNIQTNNKFVRGLSYLMYEWNGVKDMHKDITILSLVGKIESCIRKVASVIRENPQIRRSVKKDIMAMDALKVSIDGARSGIDGAETPREIYKKDNTVLYLVIGVVVVFTGYFLYKYFKEKKDAELLASGGAVSTAGESVLNPNHTVDTALATPPIAPTVQSPTVEQPSVAQPITQHPNPPADVYIVTPSVTSGQVVQAAPAQSSVNINAMSNA